MTKKQRGVVRGIGAGAALTLCVVLAPFYWPGFPSAPAEPAALLRLWLGVCLVVAFWLVVAVGRIARHRFFNAGDIDGGAAASGSEHVRILQSVLQNTMEQSVLAVVAYGGWFFFAPPKWGLLPVGCAALYSLGRLLFFAGYAGGAPARALGFALTFYPSVILIFGALIMAALRLG